MAGRKVRVLYDFDGDTASGELIISTDEVLVVTCMDVGEGWWEGTNQEGTRGLFPEAYVELFEDEPPPPPTMPPPSMMPPPSTMPPPMMAPVVPSAPSAPAAPRYQTKSPENDDGEGWDDDDWDEDTASSCSGGNSQVSTMSRRDTGSSIQRTGTVRKSINRFSVFVKSGGEAYLLGTSNDKAHCPASERVKILPLDGEGSASMIWQLSAESFNPTVTEPEKKSKFKGMKSFIAYNVGKSNSNTVVSRRFKHFDWLFNRLVDKYTLIAIPPLPDKQITGRFVEDFVEKRREKLEMWLIRICQHPVLTNCSVVTHFLTCSDSEKEWKAGKRKAESDKFMGAAFFKTVDNPPTNLSIYAVENHIENFGKFIKSMDDNVKNIAERATTHCEKCYGSYKSEYKKIGATFTGLGQAFAIEDNTANSKTLTQAIDHTGQTYDDIGELFAEQPKEDFIPLIDGLKEYSGMLSTYPEILQVHKTSVTRVKEFQKLKEEDKVEDTTFQDVYNRADTITAVSFAEMNHFHQLRIQDFKSMMKNFLREQITFHQNIIDKLEESCTMFDSVQ